MNTTLKDTIEKEIILRAPRERVYAAITEPEQLVRWFPDAVEGTVVVGKQLLFDFGEYGKNAIYVQAAVPPSYFAFRWVSGSVFIPHGFQGDVLAHPNTLVEFHLEDAPEGTRLRLVESGFASLPAEHYAQSIEDNTGGWDYMLNRLGQLLG